MFLLSIPVLIWASTPLARSAPVQLTEQAPVMITNVAPGVILIDFGKVAFGNISLTPPANASSTVTIHFGEALSDGRIDRHPPGSVRYAVAEAVLDGDKTLQVSPAPNARNTLQPAAVLTPPEWGVVLPFRWVEVENWPGEMQPEQIRRQAAFASDWNEQASAFETSDPMLNRIWDLSRYSIKATTFAGVYVDGDRERIAYEADAYFSQLGRLYADGDVQMARDTFDRLLQHPTWPTEWAPHVIFMAYADWMQTGDTNWLAARYAALKPKLQLDRALSDGLIGSTAAQIKKGDVVDWPEGERDGYVFTPVNTVANAFHLRALMMMSKLASALNQTADADDYAARERTALAAFQEKLFDPASGLYRDGEGTDHSSLHANLFPLAFGLVPDGQRAHIAQWLGQRGMKCSVYAAQYLLEGLFENGQADQAIALMTAPGDRSWRHMVESGTTITWEAWDQHYKPNQDWNHAWGAAPANLLPRFVLGAQPLVPGWKRALIQPHAGPLVQASGKIPTALGPISIAWKNPGGFKLSLVLPPQMSAQVDIPAQDNSTGVVVNGKPVHAKRDGQWWILEKDVTGSASIEAR
ncbi:MAG TPA: family 78 glycoside hydrolase catalytic domain [Verrucomicrobiae bacterium]|nr:family 78 glycoside hydrolase catalytic domain [Verrucomicrobiae bacterium]